MSEWQPIETAPKDGTDIIVYPAWVEHIGGSQFRKRSGEARWRDGKRSKRWEAFGMRIGCEPTHWMPLPEPPK